MLCARVHEDHLVFSQVCIPVSKIDISVFLKSLLIFTINCLEDISILVLNLYHAAYLLFQCVDFCEEKGL